MLTDLRERDQCKRETLTRDQTRNLGMCSDWNCNILVNGTTLQATEPPSQGYFLSVLKNSPWLVWLSGLIPGL